MFELKEYQTVILAAFLHDGGKLLGRGTFKLLEKGQHPKFSSDFISAHKDVFAQVTDPDLLRELVQRHHENRRAFSPEFLVQEIADAHRRTLATLVSKADNLSSAERGETSGQWQDYKTTPLSSVLERLDRQSDEGMRLRFRARPLSPTASLNMIFPEEFPEYQTGEINKLVAGFGRDFSRLFGSGDKAVNSNDFDCLITHLTNLIYTYTWCLPSNTQEAVPDVSLFDHLKTTAAIAACFYQYHSETGTLDEKQVTDGNIRRFILAVGDLSGIQRYIFDIAKTGEAGGVAKRLRARSLYVQLCSEVTAHRILRRLELPLWNMVMNSGGRFYLLLPNLNKTRLALEEAQRDIDEWFLRELNGELALNLAYQDFGDEGFKPGPGSDTGFSKVLRQVTSALNKRKQNRFAQALCQGGRWREEAFVRPLSFEGKDDCRSCHKFPREREELCCHCQRDREVGSRLPTVRYLSFFADPHAGEIPVLGYSVSVTASPPERGNPYLIMKLNDTDVTELTQCPALTKYLATHVARTDGETATFEQIASHSQGQHLLGFLKADVDRLGELFVFGLKRETNSIDTISRQATLSRLLDIFFTGWIEHLTCSEPENYYTVFSGGDDLFLVGRWDKIIGLAEQIRADFARFTGSPIAEQRISLSAGIIIARPDYPIARAAEAAEDAVKKSKHEGDNRTAKVGEAGQADIDHRGDRITILGETLTWADWSKVSDEWKRLSPLVTKDSTVPSAFLYNLLRFSEMWRTYGKGDVLGLRYQPLLAYNIARNLDRRRTPELYAWAEKLLKWPPDEHEKMILDNLALITSLLIYGRRGGKE